MLMLFCALYLISSIGYFYLLNKNGPYIFGEIVLNVVVSLFVGFIPPIIVFLGYGFSQIVFH